MKKYIIKTFPSLDSITWGTVKKACISSFSWCKKPAFSSFGKMVMIKNYGFVVRLSSNQKDPWALYDKDGDPVYLDSALEFFCAFTDEGYINLENNCKGIRLQGFGTGRENRKNLLLDKDSNFITKAKVTKTNWFVDIYIPFITLERVFSNFKTSAFKKGFVFYGNFYKTGTDPITKEEHYVMWNKIISKNPDFHRPEQFGEFVIE